MQNGVDACQNNNLFRLTFASISVFFCKDNIFFVFYR